MRACPSTSGTRENVYNVKYVKYIGQLLFFWNKINSEIFTASNETISHSS